VTPQHRGIIEAGPVGDLGDGETSGFQQAGGEANLLGNQPCTWGRAGCRAELAVKRAAAHGGDLGEPGGGRPLRQVLQRPSHGRANWLPGTVRERLLDELGLPAVPVRACDKAAGQARGDLGTVVLAHQVEAEIDARHHATGGQDVAVIDIQRLGDDLDQRVGRGQGCAEPPVRGRAAVIQQPGRGQHERAQANRHDAAATRCGNRQRLEQLILGPLASMAGNRQHHDRVGRGQGLHPPVDD